MLRIRVRIRRSDRKHEHDLIALVNSAFIGVKPEMVLPPSIVKDLRLNDVITPKPSRRLLVSGEAVLDKYDDAILVSAITEDFETNTILTTVLSIEGAKQALINDKLAGKLGLVILNLGEGLWCFRHELGMRVRKTL